MGGIGGLPANVRPFGGFGVYHDEGPEHKAWGGKVLG